MDTFVGFISDFSTLTFSVDLPLGGSLAFFSVAGVSPRVTMEISSVFAAVEGEVSVSKDQLHCCAKMKVTFETDVLCILDGNFYAYTIVTARKNKVPFETNVFTPFGR